MSSQHSLNEIDRLKAEERTAKEALRQAIHAFKTTDRGNKNARKLHMQEQTQAQTRLETIQTALKDAQFSAISQHAVQLRTTKEPQYAIVREEGLKQHQAIISTRKKDGTYAEGQFATVIAPNSKVLLPSKKPLELELEAQQRVQAGIRKETAQHTEIKQPSKQEEAITKQIQENKPLTDIINTLRTKNQTYMDSYYAKGKGGTKPLTSPKALSPFANTTAKYHHAADRDEDLRLLLEKSKTLPYISLKSQLEAHLKTYQHQEKQDRAVGGGLIKGQVQKMLDAAQKKLKILPKHGSAPIIEPTQTRPRL